jgi:hypothetical protein
VPRWLKRERQNLEAETRSGPHTDTIDVAQARDGYGAKAYTSTCVTDTLPGAMAGLVGWAQAEIGLLGDACGAFVLERSVRFDTRILDAIPFKTIDHAELLFEEAAGANCDMVPGHTHHCWQNGDGVPVPKSNGCVNVLDSSIDWAATPGTALLPTLGGAPTVARIDVGRWDVTEAARRQIVPSSTPLGVSPGFGFLLTGSLALDQLTAQDNAVCVSSLSNVRLRVDYNILPPGEPFRPPH